MDYNKLMIILQVEFKDGGYAEIEGKLISIWPCSETVKTMSLDVFMVEYPSYFNELLTRKLIKACNE